MVGTRQERLDIWLIHKTLGYFESIISKIDLLMSECVYFINFERHFIIITNKGSLKKYGLFYDAEPKVARPIDFVFKAWLRDKGPTSPK